MTLPISMILKDVIMINILDVFPCIYYRHYRKKLFDILILTAYFKLT